jgi:hypothetical protein
MMERFLATWSKGTSELSMPQLNGHFEVTAALH